MLFSDFQFGFSFTRLTAVFGATICDRIARAFSRSGATRYCFYKQSSC